MSKHHTVPKFYVANFCDAAGQIHFYDKRSNRRNKRVEPRNPESVFFEKHQNSVYLENGKADESLEDGFARQDTIACNMIRDVLSVLDADALPQLGSNFRKQWDVYFHFLIKRQPEFLAKLAEPDLNQIFQDAYDKRKSEAGEEVAKEELEEITSEMIDRDKHNATQEARGLISNNILNCLNQKNLIFVKIVDKCEMFCVGSNLFVYFGATGDLRDESTSLFAPLSSRYGFAYVSTSINESIINFNGDDVRMTNLNVAKQSRMFGSAERNLTQSLVAAVD